MSFRAEDETAIVRALDCLRASHHYEMRRIRIEGLEDEDGHSGPDGWIEFSYDKDGLLEVEKISDTVQYIRKKTGKASVCWQAVNAAWRAAFALAPQSQNHPAVCHPVGTIWRGGRVISYSDGQAVVDFGGTKGERSVPISHMLGRS